MNTPDDLGYSRDVAVGELEIRLDRPRPLKKQLRSFGGLQFSRPRHIHGWQRQGRNLKSRLPVD
jgi:hypothetical protein